ncbi:MAG TPA: HAD family hydrolase [Bryobacteraceae bacterium]|nr:HAD family hydrolase [Bryobacteraceae bacterium]
MKAIIFDIDGTLIDSVDYHAEAWQKVLRRHGIEVEYESVRNQIGKGGDKLMAVFLSPAQIKREAKQIEQERGELFRREYLPKVKPFPALHQLFERLKRDRIKIALASSAKRDELEAYKQITGIGPYLEAATSSDDAAESKPDPGIFLAALNGLRGVEPSQALVVGDTPYDAEAAARAGMPAVGVLCGGFAPEKLIAAGCRKLYRDPEELLLGFDGLLAAFQ